MSIAPPSDIILDVAQAADPLKLQAATSKLARAAAEAGGTSTSFTAALDSASAATPRAPGPTGPLPLSLRPSGAAVPTAVDPRHAANQKFEAMVLQSFIENILPKDADLFGDAASADMGRSLLSEQVANQMAKSGRIGIAKSMDRVAASAPAAQQLPLATPAVPST